MIDIENIVVDKVIDRLTNNFENIRNTVAFHTGTFVSTGAVYSVSTLAISGTFGVSWGMESSCESIVFVRNYYFPL